MYENIIAFVEKYTDVEFILIIPPYSRILDAINAQYNKPYFHRIKESIRYLVAQSEKHRNLKIYGWSDSDYPDDIANYKDLTHYKYTFNTKMLELIRDNIGLLSNENIATYLKIFSDKSVEYDVISIGEKIQRYLEQNINQ